MGIQQLQLQQSIQQPLTKQKIPRKKELIIQLLQLQ